MKKIRCYGIWVVVLLLLAGVDTGRGEEKAGTPRSVGEGLRYVEFGAYKPRGPEMTVIFVDVGQGDCIYFQTPGGKNVLLDGGGTPSWSTMNYEPGEETVVPFLKKREVGQLDFVLISHPHADHIGGLLSVFKQIPVTTFEDPALEQSEPEYPELLKIVQEKKVDYADVGEGDVLEWDPALRVEVFNPSRDFLAENLNNDSVVVSVRYKQARFLFMGDAEKETESRLLHQYKDRLKADVLKVGHHGSRTSTSARFLDAVGPQTAIISCGRKNVFKHPHPETVSRIASKGIRIFRTDEDGHVELRTDGQIYTVIIQKHE